jgi:tRNA threonylcarbamoyladenosine biosynthesis protein TsaE
MRTTSPDDTRALGERFAGGLKPGAVVALEGELGAGKTCFVQGMARGLGVSRKAFVRSPSFTILNQYDGRLKLYHLDFYRLNHEDDLDDLGIEEFFDGDGITVVEWADKFETALPDRTIRVRFGIIDENTREIEIP